MYRTAAITAALALAVPAAPARAATGTTTAVGTMYLGISYTPGLTTTAEPQSLTGVGHETYNRIAVECRDVFGRAVRWYGTLRVGDPEPFTGSTGPESFQVGTGSFPIGRMHDRFGQVVADLPVGTYVGENASFEAVAVADYVRSGTSMALGLRLTGIQIDPDGLGSTFGPIPCADAGGFAELYGVITGVEGTAVTTPLRRMGFYGTYTVTG